MSILDKKIQQEAEDFGWSDLKFITQTRVFVSLNARWAPEEVQTGFIKDDIEINKL